MADDGPDRPKIIIQRPKLAPHVTMFTSLSIIILAFFILLNAFSTIDEERQWEAISSLQLEFAGIFEKAGRLFAFMESSGYEIVEAKEVEEYPGEELVYKIITSSYDSYSSLESYVQERGLGGRVGIVVTPRGLVVTVGGDLTFAPAGAQLTEEGRGFLDRLAAIVRPFRNDILIEGHTDNAVPAGTVFRNNWELSQARAMAVLRHLNSGGISLGRLAAVGAGEHRPLVENDTAEQMELNRRVEIIVKHPSYGSPREAR